MVGDIGKVLDVDRGPWIEPEYRATDDPAVAVGLITELRLGPDTLVVDIEVGVEKDTGFDHPNNYDLLCVGLFNPAAGAVVLGSGALSDGDVRVALRTLLASKKLIAHNGKFDLAGLYPTLGVLRLYFDTMLASYCLDERPGNHALKVLAVEKLGAPKYDDEILAYIPKRGNYADIPRAVLYKYNAMDVYCTWLLYEMFVPKLNSPPPVWWYDWLPAKTLRDVHDHLVDGSNELMFLELNGIAVDKQYNWQLGEMFEESLRKLEEEINAIVGSEINPRSPAQVKDYLNSQGLRPASTNVATLTALLERVDGTSDAASFMRTLLRHRREAKLNSTYVEGLRRRIYRGRVYTTYLLHGSTSGRLASRNPNLQNVVRDKRIKRQYVASQEGRVLVAADYKQAEARVMATLSRDEYLQHVLSSDDIDIFDDLSDQIYGPGNWQKHIERVRIKAFFYGLGYGREAPSIAAEFKMPLQEAYKLRDEFMARIPGVAAWQNKIRKEVLSRGQLITPFGRRRRFHLITDQNKREVFNEALSYLPQSTASDICLRALIRLRPMLKGLALIRLTIHDALVAECEDSQRDAVSQMLKTVMAECGAEFTDYVPFPVDVSYGKDWGSL
jgi:DNA polymerase-1